MVLFLRHIICLLRRMVLYVDHGGLLGDLKGGRGGDVGPLKIVKISSSNLQIRPSNLQISFR